MMCQRIGMPPISIIGFGRSAVSSPSLVPRPPARMTVFINPPSRAPVANAPWRRLVNKRYLLLTNLLQGALATGARLGGLMKTVILAGGLGTRLGEETALRPKPMIEIGGMPILWHIMKIYSSFGFNDFVICLGYKGYIIKEYFHNYFLH